MNEYKRQNERECPPVTKDPAGQPKPPGTGKDCPEPTKPEYPELPPPPACPESDCYCPPGPGGTSNCLEDLISEQAGKIATAKKTEAFKTALRNAKSIAYVEQGATGIYLKELFVRIGIADEIKSKIKLAPTAAANFVANGEAEIGMTQISEILPFPGAELVGPLPADIQLYTSFAGANSVAAKQSDAGKALLKFLTTPDTAKVMKAKGLDPAS